MEYETSKKAGISKKVTLDPANLIPGSFALFWQEVATNATNSPSFLEKRQVVFASTARAFCESAVESKMKRMANGETHEGAFAKTGEGEDDIDSISLDSEAQTKQAELVADLSYQIEQMLHIHVTKILERDKATAEQHLGASVASVASVGAQGKIPAGMKRVLNPPAPLNDLSDASLNGSRNKKVKDGPDADKDSFRTIRAKQADKQLKIASDFNSLAEQLIAASKPSTEATLAQMKEAEESQIRVSQAHTQHLAVACESFATKVVAAWKAPLEVPKKEGHLINISATALHKRISEIGEVFKRNESLENALLANGIDGAMLSFMSDESIVEFFTTSCNLNKLQASMLLAKIKSWD
jgi:hypothetical protein